MKGSIEEGKPVKTHKQYTKEFKREAVRWSRQPGMNQSQVTRDLGIHRSQLTTWIYQAETEGGDAFAGNGNRTELEAEVLALRRRLRIAEEERDILKKSGHVVREAERVKFSFIEGHRCWWRLGRMCRMLGVSKSGYFSWRHRPESHRSGEDRALTTRIQVIHSESRKTYGSPRVHRELRFQGTSISRKRVERLMREAGVRLKPQARFVVTTDSNHDLPIAPNLLQRQHFAVA